MKLKTAALACCVLATSAACERRGKPRPLPPRAAGVAFVAFERDFTGFRGWEALPVPERSTAQGITHVAGRRREWINGRPGVGAREFPVGTILVKEIESGMPEGHKVFAMVKRGGGYNAEGAKGWEWFELFERDDGSVGITWRGINAPEGESYGSGDPLGGCNGCHETATANDYVKAAAAELGTLVLAAERR